MNYTTIHLHKTINIILFSLQEFSPAIDNEPDHIIEKRRPIGRHDQYETLAQMTCTSMAIKNGRSGWIYAVRRKCRYTTYSCRFICGISTLAMQDPQTRHLRWTAIGALYVYAPRSISYTSTIQRPSLGLKVKWYPHYHRVLGCGPNFCCCFVQS